MKTCLKCNLEKEDSFFYKQKQICQTGTICNYKDSYCKDCRAIYSYERRIAVKSKCVEYMGGKCSICGLKDEDCVYDFHHIDPQQKDFSISDRPTRSFEKLKIELDKCILICSNCHRKIHKNNYLESIQSQITTSKPTSL